MFSTIKSVELIEEDILLYKGREIVSHDQASAQNVSNGPEGTITYGILAAHTKNREKDQENLRLSFDILASHDITYVAIIQTAKASGLSAFPVPYILTNCHNSLSAVGGTINSDDHAFGLSAARKYGGVFVPPHLAVIHSYMRENWAGCGKMILGSDSHTRYGALGTLAVGEGGGELVKQLLSQPYEIKQPKVIAVYLEGEPQSWVGPMDIALSLIGTVYKNGLAKNAVLEFVGPGIAALSAEYRNAIDVMTTETSCWSSIWETDQTTQKYLDLHGRSGDYRELKPAQYARYNGMIKINLDKVKPMIALPFHPSNVYELEEVLTNPGDIFNQIEKEAAALFEKPAYTSSGRQSILGLMEKIDCQGYIHVDQGIIAGCAGGTFDSIMAVADILNNRQTQSQTPPINDTINSTFSLSVYPGSQPLCLEIARNGALAKLINAGALVKTAFCGPCFGAGDIPANQNFSIRHCTRNFPNREGSKPNQGQIASVALMDSLSIAATAYKGGILSSAEGMAINNKNHSYTFDKTPYLIRVYNGIGKAEPEFQLCYGPNINDWPPMEALGDKLLLKIVSFITDPVTTTDELIPSGETSSYRSNPLALAEFTLSRKDPAYAGRAKEVRDRTNTAELEAVLNTCYSLLKDKQTKAKEIETAGTIQIASAIYAHKPGDGSAREQAASCQRVLGGAANFAKEYATKRYVSNLINWGIIPFLIDGEPLFKNDDFIFIPEIKTLIRGDKTTIQGYILRPEHCGTVQQSCTCNLTVPDLNPMERELLEAGSLINYNRGKQDG